MKPNQDERNKAARTAETLVKAFFQDARLPNIFSMTPGDYLPGKTTPTLWAKAQTIAEEKAAAIARECVNNGASLTTITRIVFRWCQALTGFTDPLATPDNIAQELDAISPKAAFKIDRYALYWGVLSRLQILQNMREKYAEKVTGEGATDEARLQFMKADYTLDEYVALYWLFLSGDIQINHLEKYGDTARAFLLDLTIFGLLGYYCQYYTVAKYELNATDQELREIPRPPLPEEAREYIRDSADGYAQDRRKDIDTDKYAEETKTSLEELAQTQFRPGNAVTWKDEDILKLHGSIGALLSRPLDVSATGKEFENPGGVVPFDYLIDAQKITINNPDYPLTQRAVQWALMGIDNLPNVMPNIKPEGGFYTYKTTISDFAEYCGLVDVGQEGWNQLKNSIVFLQNHYLVVQRPVRYIEDHKGRKRKTGGAEAIQLVALESFGVDTGGITLRIPEDLYKGSYKLMAYGTLAKLKQAIRGEAAGRLLAQVIFKSHIMEADLIDQVFGYDAKIRTAQRKVRDADYLKGEERKKKMEAAEEELKKVKRYISVHRSADAKKVRDWLDKLQATGEMRYSLEEGRNGKVYNFTVNGHGVRAQEPAQQIQEGSEE